MTMKQKRVVIAHAHLFKNAGSTIDWILKRNFAKRFADNREDCKMGTDPSYLFEFLDSNPRLSALSSHSLPLPIPESEWFEFHTIAMIRHPLLRVRSVYEFERKQPESTPGSIHAKKYSFSEYVRWRMRNEVAATIRNFHVRFLTHNRFAANFEIGQQRLEAAIQLVKSNRLVGIVEIFDESMVVFDTFLSAAGVNVDFSYKKQNVSKSMPTTDADKLTRLQNELGVSLYAELLERNKLDLMLYTESKAIVMSRYLNVPDRQGKLGSLHDKSALL
jgi:hypothetical protein